MVNVVAITTITMFIFITPRTKYLPCVDNEGRPRRDAMLSGIHVVIVILSNVMPGN